MKKLSNGIEYDNAYFNPHFGEYLIANGFKTSCQGNKLKFYTERLAVCIMANNIDVFVFQYDRSKERDAYVFCKSHFGYGHMDLFMWMMLMHVMEVVKLQDFMNRAAAGDDQIKLESKKLVEFLVYTQIPQAAAV